MNSILEPQPDCESPKAIIQNDNVLNLLQMKRTRLEGQLTDINNAIKALEQNPEVTKILTLLAKTKAF